MLVLIGSNNSLMWPSYVMAVKTTGSEIFDFYVKQAWRIRCYVRYSLPKVNYSSGVNISLGIGFIVYLENLGAEVTSREPTERVKDSSDGLNSW